MEPITLEEYAEGVATLVRLAGDGTSGSRAAAQVLLSAYNGADWQLDITDLCVLDHGHYVAALAVIRGRTEICVEPHELIADGGRHFQRLWEQWSRYHIDNRWKKQCPECYGSGLIFENKDDELEGSQVTCWRCDGEGIVAE